MASPAPKPGSDQASESTTDSGLALKPVYRSEDAGPQAPDPGQYPFTRGIYPEMYRRRPWTIRQYAGGTSPGRCRRSEEHTSELQSLTNLVCRLLREKKNHNS